MFLIGTTISENEEVAASGNWKGYALYRDGVLGNLNDHAALMDSYNISQNYPIIQASGPNKVVDWVSWFGFLDGENYIGLYKPNNCNMSYWGERFVSRARELRGIPYIALGQIDYEDGSYSLVTPQRITNLRCDGVVEYVYEWFGFRVWGSDNGWDISRNALLNISEHTGFIISPRMQRNFLQQVSTNPPN